MPLAFLVPAMLAGLAALAIPLVLHLRRRERERPTRFPSLMFLRRITITTARRRRITDLPLLLLRALIVALIVMAFARPLVRRPPGAATPQGPRRVVIALDRSMSMGHTAVWPTVLDSARAIMAGLAPIDRVAIVAFDDEARVEQPWTLDRQAARAAIERIRPGDRGTSYGAAFRTAAAAWLADRDAVGTDELFLITDAQRSATLPSGIAMPSGATIHVVDVAPHGHGNVAVSGVSVVPASAGATQRAAMISASIASFHLPAPRTVTAVLEANGRVSGTRRVTVPRDGTTAVAFDPVPVSVGNVRLAVRIDHDSLSADDVFRAVLRGELVRRVVMVDPPGADSRETWYLERALEVGSDPSIRVEHRVARALSPALLRDVLAVVLYDVPPPPATTPAGAALADWIQGGGGLLVVAGHRMVMSRAASTLLPASVDGMIDRRNGSRSGDAGGGGRRSGVGGAGSAGTLQSVALDHPIFAPFRGEAAASLAGVEFYRYPRLRAAPDAQVVARFDDGSAALVVGTDSLGRVIVSGIPLDVVSGDFPLQPAYLPLVRSLVRYVSGQGTVPYWRVTGAPWTVAGVLNPVVKAPDGTVMRPARRTTAVDRVVALDEAGFYAAYPGRVDGDPASVAAVNPPTSESDLGAMDPRRLLPAATVNADAGAGLGGGGQGGARQQQRSAAPPTRPRCRVRSIDSGCGARC